MHEVTPMTANATADRPFDSGSRSIVITADPAWPPISGGDLRNWQNARALASRGDVLLASIYEHVSPSSPEIPRIRAIGLASTTENKAGPRIAKRRTPLDSRISKIALERLLKEIRALRPETIVVEGISLFALLKHLRPLPAKLVLDMHNIESDVSRQVTGKTSWLMALLSKKGRNPRRLREMELDALPLVDKVWVCSDQDRERLRALSNDKTTADVVPNGIPRFEDIPDKLPEQPPRIDGKPTVLFVGHLNYRPNIDAAQRLATRILPGLREALGGAHLVIAGRAPHQSLTDLAKLPDVELVASPESLNEFYRNSHMTIVPLTSGGGTRLKILEAMAWGLPVVATRLAAEGLDLIDGLDIDFGETDDELVARAVSLCVDNDERQRRRLRARKTVEQRFSPKAIEMAIRASLG